ncbi:spore coat protein GerQ [Bacillus sp. B15-48]|nr:spore coat protein GerQ [Bacillus sp. B15-48]
MQPQAYTPFAAQPQTGPQHAYPYTKPAGQMPMTGAFPPAGVAPSMAGTGVQVPGMLPIEASYIENILRLNKGKLATVYMSFEGSQEWNSKIFKGIIEAAGRDHLILSDPQTGMRYLLLMVYLDYVTFDEEIEYDYPFGMGVPLAAYPPR